MPLIAAILAISALFLVFRDTDEKEPKASTPAPVSERVDLASLRLRLHQDGHQGRTEGPASRPRPQGHGGAPQADAGAVRRTRRQAVRQDRAEAVRGHLAAGDHPQPGLGAGAAPLQAQRLHRLAALARA
ncbi:hypothetical protein G5V59_26745 [Nocardioides sp. W3-2-3]|uniref:hypothetical protein n=1 Tax=Nocardioides convexus TaxID=2712224 RepID=UPI0024189484|nr:hypothetical protein [Nocardioides convexus]NHA01995.1 hypothetical protein [Nocardioides convexus]